MTSSTSGVPPHSVLPLVSVVVPIYRSRHTLPELCRRILTSVAPVSSELELLLIDDGGGDGAWDVICDLASGDDRITGIQLSRNFGQHAATICGFANARGQWVVTLDDDLEHPPELIPALLDSAMAGHAVVYGVYHERSHQRWRNVTSDIARWLFAKAIPSLNHDYSSFRVVRGDLARALVQFDSPFPFVDGYLSWLTTSGSRVPVPHGTRTAGESNYTIGKLILHTINIFVTFSDVPLRMATWLGLGAFLMGMSWLSVIVARWFFGGITASGYASVMAGILLFGGVQLLVLGVFGEYLGRINFKSSRKPLFLISSRTHRIESLNTSLTRAPVDPSS